MLKYIIVLILSLSLDSDTGLTHTDYFLTVLDCQHEFKKSKWPTVFLVNASRPNRITQVDRKKPKVSVYFICGFMIEVIDFYIDEKTIGFYRDTLSNQSEYKKATYEGEIDINKNTFSNQCDNIRNYKFDQKGSAVVEIFDSDSESFFYIIAESLAEAHQAVLQAERTALNIFKKNNIPIKLKCGFTHFPS